MRLTRQKERDLFTFEADCVISSPDFSEQAAHIVYTHYIA